VKYRVVGWTYFDNTEIEGASCSEAAYQAIIKEIQDKGYEFTGHDHQNQDCCAPVLNDGKVRRFSEREWGGLMALAHGIYTYKGYLDYAFRWYIPSEKEDPRIMPNWDTEEYWPDEFTPEEVENEVITVEVSRSVFYKARVKNIITLPDCDALRFIGRGDTLVLTLGNRSESYPVLGVSRGRRLTKKQVDELWRMSTLSPKRSKELEEIYEKAPFIVNVMIRTDAPCGEGEKEEE